MEENINYEYLHADDDGIHIWLRKLDNKLLVKDFKVKKKDYKKYFDIQPYSKH